MAEQWRPVDEYGSVPNEFVVDGNRLWVGAVDEDEWIVLPPHLRLCERVEDAPITPDALQEAGWIKGFDDEYMRAPNSDTKVWAMIGSDNSCRIEIQSLGGHRIEFPNCKTMAQLAALISMLGGAE